MSWTKIAPSHYQRPLGENERLIKFIGDSSGTSDREHWTVSAVASFQASWLSATGVSYEHTKRRLRNAWKLLRFHHPSIAATAATSTLDYIVPDKRDLNQWADETFHFVDPENGVTYSDDLIASTPPSSRTYVVAYFLPKSSEIILRSSHWRLDGYGALQLVNAFFECLSSASALSALSSPASSVEDNSADELPWGEEPTRLAPSIEEVLGLPEKASLEVEAAAAHYLGTGVHVLGSVGLPYRSDPTQASPRGTRSARFLLPLQKSQSISQACAKRGIGVLSAVHASLAAVNFEAASLDTRLGHYTSTVRLGLRPYLPAPYGDNNAAAHAAALYTGGYFLKVDRSQSWSETAAEYDAAYRLGADDEFLASRRQYAVKCRELFQTRITEAKASGADQNARPRSEIDISTVDDAERLVRPLYNVDDCGQPIEVLRVSVEVECLQRESYLFFWVFRGQMDFKLVYNEAFYDADLMDGLLRRLIAVLESELLVEEISVV